MAIPRGMLPEVGRRMMTCRFRVTRRLLVYLGRVDANDALHHSGFIDPLQGQCTFEPDVFACRQKINK